MVNAVAFLLAAKLFARCFRLPRRWFGCNLVLADNFPDDDEEVADAAKLFAAKEERDILMRIIVLVLFWCAILCILYVEKSIYISVDICTKLF